MNKHDIVEEILELAIVVGVMLILFALGSEFGIVIWHGPLV